MLKHNKTFLRLFFSYLLILVIPMSILGAVNYYQTYRIVEAKIEKDSMAALNQSSYIVDSYIEKLYKLSSELSLNQRINEFIDTSSENNQDLNLLAREIMFDLRSYTILNDFIEEIYIYSETNNTFVSATGLYTPDIFFNTLYSNTYDKSSYDELLDSIKQPIYRKFIPITIKPNFIGVSEKILFKDSLPNNKDNLGCIMVFMNKRRFMNAFSDVIKEYGGCCYVLDEKLQIILTDGSRNYDDLIIEDLLLQEDVVTKKHPTNGKVLRVHTSSLNSKWKYVGIIPYDAFTKEIDSLKVSTILIISICIIVAFIISLLAANKNYKPIKNIVSFINETYKYGDSDDDYKLISNILEFSYKETKLNREILENHIPIIRHSYLTKLLKESRQVEENKSELFNTLLDICLDFTSSIIAVFNIKRISSKGDEHTETELYKIALCTAIEEMAEKSHMVYAVKLENDNIACIYGTSDEDTEKTERSIILLSMKLKDYLENKFRITLYIGIGNAYKGYKDLSYSYEEADESLSYAMLMNKNVVRFKDIRKNNNLFTFPIQKELQLINYMKTGKLNDAIRIIDDLYNENCLNKELTYDMMKFFIYDLNCCIIKAIRDLNLTYNELTIDSLKALDSQKDISFHLLDIKRKVTYVCDTVLKQRKNTSRKLKNEIVRYVEKNFLDSQLSLEKVADEFDITPQYLSRFFKEHFNVGYVDYVNRKRVNKAKEYLLNNEKIKDACAKSGFNNIGTFINAFKKHTGYKPGEFKKTIWSASQYD